MKIAAVDMYFKSDVLLVMSSIHLQQANINKVKVISGTGGGAVIRFWIRFLEETGGFPHFFYHGMFTVNLLSEVVGV